MQLFELTVWRTHKHFNNTLVPINSKTIVTKPENYFYVGDTECQMAMPHHHKQDGKHNRVVN